MFLPHLLIQSLSDSLQVVSIPLRGNRYVNRALGLLMTFWKSVSIPLRGNRYVNFGVDAEDEQAALGFHPLTGK